MKLLLILMSMILVSTAFASGTTIGNGGDMCEDHFKIIRDDIASWIKQGGSSGLSLPEGVTIEKYNSSMLEKISKAQISCVDDKIMIGSAEKTCKNFFDIYGTQKIICNRSRFLAMSESDSYVLVHHEYAGLAGLEVNIAEDSNYSISNQIGEYLQNQIVKKLSIKKVANLFASIDDVKSIQCTDTMATPISEVSFSTKDPAAKLFERKKNGIPYAYKNTKSPTLDHLAGQMFQTNNSRKDGGVITLLDSWDSENPSQLVLYPTAVSNKYTGVLSGLTETENGWEKMENHMMDCFLQ